jgi:hypothetical protein
MRLHALAVLGTALAAATILPSSSSAQSRVRFGISAGMTVTNDGGWDRGYERGRNAQFSMELERVIGRLGLRADAGVYAFRRETFGGPLSSRTTVPGASANLVLPVGPAAAKLQPYLLAGAGGYRTEYGAPAAWHLGFNGGGGLRLGIGRADVFVEARMSKIADSSTPRFVPISLGFRF